MCSDKSSIRCILVSLEKRIDSMLKTSGKLKELLVRCREHVEVLVKYS